MENSSLYVKILKWGIFISLFLPLVIFSQYISPFHFGKVIIFRILVELMAVFYFILILMDKSYRPKWSPVLITFSVFTALYVLTGIIGADFYNSFWGSLERMGGIFSFLHFWVYFVILISIIKSKKDWQKVLKISVLVGLLSILFAYGQRLELGNFFVGWQHGERVIGTIGNPALFAGYLLFIIYLALLFLLQKETPIKEKGFFTAVILLGIPVLFMTAVRGAMLSLLGSALLLILFFIFKASSKKVKIGLLMTVILIVGLAGFAWANKDSSWVKNISWLSRLTDISKGTDTVQTRLWSWDSAIKGWKDRSIFGWGPENFMYLHMRYFNSNLFTQMGSETIWDRAHNMVLEELSTMGVVGLLSYLSVFLIIFYLLIKRFKQGKINKIDFGIMSAMIIAYFGQNLFIFDTFANYFLFFLSLGYINFLTQDSLKEENTEQEKIIIQKTPSPFLITILLILAIILGYQTGIKPAQANFACTRAIIAGRDGNGQKALDKYRQALNYKNPQGAYEIRHKLAAFVIQVVDSQRQKNKDFDPAILYYAISETEKNVGKYPLDTTPYLYIGRMYILLMSKEPGAGDKAEEYIQKAIDLNPNNPRIWYEMGQAKLSNKKYQESYNSFKKALDLNPKVNLSWWFLSNVAFQLEKYDEAVYNAEKAIELGYNGYQNSITDLMRLVTIYEKVGNYQKVLEYYIMAAEEQPQNPQIHASLAVAYAKMGYRDEAIKSALKAAELDPSFQGEADKFIESLSR
jgi:tetratricopeptide (TPR) repeat protein